MLGKQLLKILSALGLVDGGFGRADPGTLPLFTEARDGGQAVTTSTGQRKVIPKKADFGTLSSGGLY